MINEVYEYTVDKKKEGKYKLARFLMVGLYCAFFIGLFALVLYTKLYPTFAIAPVLLWILVLATWRYVSIEYKYTVESGVLTLMTVYGSKTRRVKSSFKIKELTAFLPLESAAEKIAEFKANVTYNLLSSNKSPKDAYALMVLKDGKRILALIEAPTPSLKEILYYATEEIRKGARS